MNLIVYMFSDAFLVFEKIERIGELIELNHAEVSCADCGLIVILSTTTMERADGSLSPHCRIEVMV
jgi:hypothetical protein